MNMYGNSEPELTNQQKAAILFIVLGPEYSSMLFKHMNDEEIEKLTLEIANHKQVTPEEKKAVVSEFYQMAMAKNYLSQGGLDITFTGESMQTYQPDLGMIGMPYLIQSDEQMEKGLTESKAAAIVRSGDMAAIKANGLEGFKRDTIWVSLYDSLFASKGINPDSLRYIPFSDCDGEQADTFEIIACPNTMKSGAIQQVMECNAPFSSYLKGMGKRGKRAIMNRTQEAEEKGAYAGLKIGEAGNGWNNNAGNWE